MNDTIQLCSSLDCCSKREIERNKEEGIICDICDNTGYLVPKTKATPEGDKR